ncbi:MAG TPA: sigma-70 family RNA polymerase sigma factor [Rhizomicrobium sp.]|jgi:RNA polymerase sigma-70 factor (ECF subfamily)|nr:sigma-70 family RNA polymerase sigma factor [Rhizomicrobium sp.]
MNEQILLADQSGANRPRLRAVAYRMLGSLGEADDAVQETWLRLARSDSDEIGNLGGWLTTVLARVCLDMLRSRKSRREEPLESSAVEPGRHVESTINPEQESMLADSVGIALLVVLQTLDPAERVAFVLHDMFDLPFEEIAAILGRSPVAARQLASRARRRVRKPAQIPGEELARQRKVVDAFLAASHDGDLNALLAVLDPDVVFRADDAAAKAGARSEIRGAAEVARTFKGRAQGARPALVNGSIGLLVVRSGRLFVVLVPRIAEGKIVEIDAVADSGHLRRLELSVLSD